jgi:hypothetical protein
MRLYTETIISMRSGQDRCVSHSSHPDLPCAYAATQHVSISGLPTLRHAKRVPSGGNRFWFRWPVELSGGDALEKDNARYDTKVDQYYRYPDVNFNASRHPAAAHRGAFACGALGTLRPGDPAGALAVRCPVPFIVNSP